MKKRYFILSLLLFLLAYLIWYPVPIDPVSWTPPQDIGLTAEFESNEKLANIQYLFPGECYKCEDIALDSLGQIYGGSEHGEIIQFDKNGTRKVLINTGGRPLGLHFDDSGMLYIADAYKGLLSLDETNNMEVLSTEANGKKFAFVDDLEIASDGVVYFSDASWKFSIKDVNMDFMEHRPNGRLLSYDPRTKETKMLLDGLYFANGISLSDDNSFVLVNETSRYQITRYWLKGSKKGQSDIFIDNLPGFPDGISNGGNGIFWLAFAFPRDQSLDNLLPKPFLRKVIVRLPKALQPYPVNYSFIIGLDEDANVIHNFQATGATFTQITSVQQYENKLFLGSIGEDGVGVFELKQ